MSEVREAPCPWCGAEIDVFTDEVKEGPYRARAVKVVICTAHCGWQDVIPVRGVQWSGLTPRLQGPEPEVQ